MYLYVIGPEKGPHKIGFSSDPVKRLAALQSGNADIIICHAVSKNDCAPRYERELHDRFKSNRIAGEWFSNSLDEIVKAMEALGLSVELDPFPRSRHNRGQLSETTLASLFNGVCDAEMFREWRECLGLSRTAAADELGMGRNQPQRYEDGQPIPRYVALACAAIAHGLPPIGD